MNNEEIQKLLDTELLDNNTAFNILVSAVNESYDKPHFNDLDRLLIAKSLTAFKVCIDKGENIVIVVEPEDKNISL